MFARSPFDELFYVFRDLDSLFRRTFPDITPALSETGSLRPSIAAPSTALTPAAGSRWPSMAWSYQPAVESFTKEGKLFIRAELPGVDPADLHVSVIGNHLQISGEKKVARELDEADVYFREIAQGRFERNFKLPEGVKSDQLKAKFENGVLELTMPVPEAAQTKQIPVEVVSGGKQIKAA